MTFLSVRIVGNELPPRDRPGSRLEGLRWILGRRQSRPAGRFWLLNHLFDADYRAEVIRLLEAYREPYAELHFDPERYRRCRGRGERLCYAININAARNVAVRHGQRHARFTVCLDQDCFFTEAQWAQVTSAIYADQRRSDRSYYGVATKRILRESDLQRLVDLPDEELQLIFRSDAQRLFDPTIPFGNNDKVELMRWLGYGPGPDYVLSGSRCRTVGSVCHWAGGPDRVERHLAPRMRARRRSLDRLLRMLDARYGVT